MKVVVDANRVFSALLRDGSTRRLFFQTSAQLYAPDLLRREIERHEPQIRTRTGLSKGDLHGLLKRVLAPVHWVDEASLVPHIARAARALAHRDPQDVAYLACALAIRADAIWSHDEDFDAQAVVRRVTNAHLP